ncbi:MAG: type IV toxin-antitoxin system AbiEi family antitoxin domain-containing protein, partial [Solirubrobacterales bacterium]|nr:type IV toxin-antitoxin system AbiEi family antitoxin domain-containing protein [Solirubrobacterales bacterium]
MREVERAIARIAGRQDNVISRDQLIGAGVGRGAIAHRVRVGWMQRMHQGVYLLGAAPPPPMAGARAAAIACGASAVVSHRSAAELLGLLPQIGGDVHVTVVGRNPHAQPGIRIHRVARLPRHEVTKMRGVRLMSVARTICDLAATEPAREVEAAFQEALYRELVSDGRLAAIIARKPRRQGVGVIRALLEDPRMTRSERERALLGLIDAAQLPRPLTNVHLHGYLLDVYWPAERLVVEFDGYRAHGHRLAFENNRKRDQVLLTHGVRTLRATDRHLT